MKAPELKSYTFDKGGWAILGFLAAATALVVYLAIHFTFRLFDSNSLSKFEDLLTSRRYEEAQETLRQLGDENSLIELFGFGSPGPHPIVKQSLNGMISTITEFHKATPKTTAERVEDILLRLEAQIPLSPLIRESLSHIQREALSITDKSIKLAQLERRYATLKSVSQSIEGEYDLLSRDASDLFNLDRAYPALRNAEEPFYSSGLLSGLPKLEDLPDNVTSAAELKTILSRLNGEVRISGSDAPQRFRNTVEHLRQASLKLSEQWSDTTTALDSLDRDLRQLRAEISQEKLNLERQLQQALMIVITETDSLL